MAQRYDLRGRHCILSDSETLVSAGLNVLQTDLARVQQVDHTVPSVPVTSEKERIKPPSNNTTTTSSLHSAAQPTGVTYKLTHFVNIATPPVRGSHNTG